MLRPGSSFLNKLDLLLLESRSMDGLQHSMWVVLSHSTVTWKIPGGSRGFEPTLSITRRMQRPHATTEPPSLLDRVKSKAFRRNSSPPLTNCFLPLKYRRTVATLSVFYRYFHAYCSSELTDCMPPPSRGHIALSFHVLFTPNTSRLLMQESASTSVLSFLLLVGSETAFLCLYFLLPKPPPLRKNTRHQEGRTPATRKEERPLPGRKNNRHHEGLESIM